MATVIPAAPVKAFPVVVAGMTGPTGPTNFDGAGPPGPIGPTGPTGRAGATGPLGSTGDQGTIGTPGNAGATGPTGAQGTAGGAGSAGATGPTGAQGSAGSGGAVGATGPTGSQGTAGTPGTPGSAGATGPTGSVGASGGIGSTGATGPAGAGSPSNVLPLMDGTATVGTSTNFAREGHIHPTDTSRAAVTYVDTQDALKVAKAGDTMTGNLTISSALPGISFNKTASGTACSLISYTASKSRWEMDLGNGSAESGGNAGSDFLIARFDDSGAFVSVPFSIERRTGVVSIGTGPFAPASMALQVGFTASSSFSGGGIGFRGIDNWYACLFQNAAGTIVGSITTSPTNTNYVTTSDERMKDDLKSFDAGNIIDDTNVYDFAWKDTGERAYGVIAQQAIDIYPTAVTHKPADDYWGIDYSKYVPVLLQELKALRARVAALEGGGLISGKPA